MSKYFCKWYFDKGSIAYIMKTNIYIKDIHILSLHEQYPCQQLQLSILSLYKSGAVIGKRSHRKPSNPIMDAILTIPEITQTNVREI